MDNKTENPLAADEESLASDFAASSLAMDLTGFCGMFGFL